ncbi:hypothetical protein jhhlp_008098 [Lomentospora prolificans]|uniref:Uncharacterized protein n=1 Tax=Lomentospora prolificans TaxID=41688 RepID=A0A2N3MZJ1_9PEZI|nr:hypothetical protein jhhlp_008098 [Lomentospora prolificans]
MGFTFARPPTLAIVSAIALLPVAATATYLVSLNRRVSKSTSAVSGQRSRSPSGTFTSSIPLSTAKPVSLPEDVASDDSEWVLSYERVVMNPISIDSLRYPAPVLSKDPTSTNSSDLLTAYSRAVQIAFSRTPQASLIRGAMKEPEVKRTFEADWINSLPFNVGDRVCGIWRVTHRGGSPRGYSRASERIECVGDPPESYKGERIGVVIVAGVEEVEGGSGDEIVFTNETWMWRRRDAKSTMIETSIGGWLHVLLAKWLIWKGVEATVSGKAKEL